MPSSSIKNRNGLQYARNCTCYYKNVEWDASKPVSQGFMTVVITVL